MPGSHHAERRLATRPGFQPVTAGGDFELGRGRSRACPLGREGSSLGRSMTALYQLLVATHIAANLVWIGSILSVAFALVSPKVDARAGAQLAYELYRKLATP